MRVPAQAGSCSWSRQCRRAGEEWSSRGDFARRALPFGVRHLTVVEKGCRLSEGLPTDVQNGSWLPHKGPRAPWAKPPAPANADGR